MGLAAGKLRIEFARAPILSAKTTTVQVSGFIQQIESLANGRQWLTILPSKIETLIATQLPAKIRVLFRHPITGLLPGDHVSFSAKLAPPPRAPVTGGSDFARYAYFSSVGAVGFATMVPVVTAAPIEPSLMLAMSDAMERVRMNIGERVTAALQW